MLEHERYSGFERKKEILEKKELSEKYWCNLAERLFVETGELGYGQTASVYDSTSETNLCLKRIKQKESRKYPYMNSLDREADFLMKLKSLVDENDGVTIPEPALLIHSESMKMVSKENLKGELVKVEERIREDVLVMDRINGPSFEDILNPKEPRFKKELPKDFDHEVFFSKLKKFVIKMNENDIYHRDLHAGNIMIDLDTGGPAIIDLGTAKERFSSEEDVYKEDLGPLGVTTFVDDMTRIKEVIDEFKTVYLQK